MNIKVKKIILLLGILFAFFLQIGGVLALEVTNYPTTLTGQSINDTSSLGDYFCYLFSFLTEVAIFITIIIIAFGGIYYLISYGRGKFTTEAKEWIKSGIVGLLFVVCSASIVYTINPS